MKKNYRALFRTGVKLLWMQITLLAPEVLHGKAWNDGQSAKPLVPEFEDFHGNVPCTKSHLYCADMGGFATKFDGEANGRSGTEDTPPVE